MLQRWKPQQSLRRNEKSSVCLIVTHLLSDCFRMPDIPAFSTSGRQAVVTSYTHNSTRVPYTTQSPSIPSPSLLHEPRKVNVFTLEIQKTSTWTSTWNGALYDDPGFPKPAVRIFFRSHSWQELTCRRKASGKTLQFDRSSLLIDVKRTKLTSSDQSAPRWALARNYLRWTKACTASNLPCSAQLLKISVERARRWGVRQPPYTFKNSFNRHWNIAESRRKLFALKDLEVVDRWAPINIGEGGSRLYRHLFWCIEKEKADWQRAEEGTRLDGWREEQLSIIG